MYFIVPRQLFVPQSTSYLWISRFKFILNYNVNQFHHQIYYSSSQSLLPGMNKNDPHLPSNIETIKRTKITTLSPMEESQFLLRNEISKCKQNFYEIFCILNKNATKDYCNESMFGKAIQTYKHSIDRNSNKNINICEDIFHLMINYSQTNENIHPSIIQFNILFSALSKSINYEKMLKIHEIYFPLMIKMNIDPQINTLNTILNGCYLLLLYINENHSHSKFESMINDIQSLINKFTFHFSDNYPNVTYDKLTIFELSKIYIYYQNAPSFWNLCQKYFISRSKNENMINNDFTSFDILFLHFLNGFSSKNIKNLSYMNKIIDHYLFVNNFQCTEDILYYHRSIFQHIFHSYIKIYLHLEEYQSVIELYEKLKAIQLKTSGIENQFIFHYSIIQNVSSAYCKILINERKCESKQRKCLLILMNGIPNDRRVNGYPDIHFSLALIQFQAILHCEWYSTVIPFFEENILKSFPNRIIIYKCLDEYGKEMASKELSLNDSKGICIQIIHVQHLSTVQALFVVRYVFRYYLLSMVNYKQDIIIHIDSGLNRDFILKPRKHRRSILEQELLQEAIVCEFKSWKYAILCYSRKMKNGHRVLVVPHAQIVQFLLVLKRRKEDRRNIVVKKERQIARKLIKK